MILSPKQLTIAKLAASGFNRKQIALNMKLSVRTVDYHLVFIYKSLNIEHNDIVSLVHWALNNEPPSRYCDNCKKLL